MPKVPNAYRTTVVVWATLVACLLGGGRAWAQTELTGKTGGAYYKIVVPDGWQPANGLVIWNQGFDLTPTGPEVNLGPDELSLLQLSQGYAVAGTTGSDTGWRLFKSIKDLKKLVKVFSKAFGNPDKVILAGAGTGGLVVAQGAENKKLGNVVGALSVCGATAGSRTWDQFFDLRMLFDYACSGVPGAGIPGGATGLPPGSELTSQEIALSVHACTGVLWTSNLRTPEQQARLDLLVSLGGFPELYLVDAMLMATLGLADLVHDAKKLSGNQAMENRFVDYGDAAVNAGIQRVAYSMKGRRKLVKNYTPTGKVGDVKIVSIHTDKDGLVIVENESEYASVVSPENLTTGIIVEDEPSHCGFTEAETVAAWETLRGWVAGDPQPTAQNLQDTCSGLVAGGLAMGPCRIDPGFVIPDLNDRVRPRH